MRVSRIVIVGKVSVITRFLTIAAKKFIFGRWGNPNGSDPQILDVIQLLSDAVPVAALRVFQFAGAVLNAECTVVAAVAIWEVSPISCANAVGANTAEIASVDASKALNARIFNVFLLFMVTSFGNCH